MTLTSSLLAIALLLVSRVLGLVRESMQAAALGHTALADSVIVMMTLPDWVCTVLAAGGLSYVLLPLWAQQSTAALQLHQRHLARRLLLLGVGLALLVVALVTPLGAYLAPGAAVVVPQTLHAALYWGALAVPLALLGSLWWTRLQHERDVVGMYGINTVHNLVVIAALTWVMVSGPGPQVLTLLGMSLLAAVGMRWGFMQWRVRRYNRVEVSSSTSTITPRTEVKVWAWASMAVGLPAVLLLVARSAVSVNGEGALASFNYAAKLIELPNQLIVGVVAALAFPVLSKAYAQGRDWKEPLQKAVLWAWSLSCAAAVVLWIAAQPLAMLLFGWGHMSPEGVEQIARWAAWGAWSLLPQAWIAMLMMMLALLQRLRAAALIYAAAVVVLLVLQRSGLHEGQHVMQVWVGLLIAIAIALMWVVRHEVAPAWPWPLMVLPVLLGGVSTGVHAAIVDEAVWKHLMLAFIAGGGMVCWSARRLQMQFPRQTKRLNRRKVRSRGRAKGVGLKGRDPGVVSGKEATLEPDHKTPIPMAAMKDEMNRPGVVMLGVEPGKKPATTQQPMATAGPESAQTLAKGEPPSPPLHLLQPAQDAVKAMSGARQPVIPGAQNSVAPPAAGSVPVTTPRVAAPSAQTAVVPIPVGASHAAPSAAQAVAGSANAVSGAAPTPTPTAVAHGTYNTAIPTATGAMQAQATAAHGAKHAAAQFAASAISPVQGEMQAAAAQSTQHFAVQPAANASSPTHSAFPNAAAHAAQYSAAQSTAVAAHQSGAAATVVSAVSALQHAVDRGVANVVNPVERVLDAGARSVHAAVAYGASLSAMGEIGRASAAQMVGMAHPSAVFSLGHDGQTRVALASLAHSAAERGSTATVTVVGLAVRGAAAYVQQLEVSLSRPLFAYATHVAAGVRDGVQATANLATVPLPGQAGANSPAAHKGPETPLAPQPGHASGQAPPLPPAADASAAHPAARGPKAG